MAPRQKSGKSLSMWLVATLICVTCQYGAAVKAQTSDTSKTLLCKYDDGGLQALCELGSASSPAGTDENLPAPDEFGIVLALYGVSRDAGGRVKLSRVREQLVAAMPELKRMVDTLIDHSQLSGDSGQLRGQLIQVMLCPYVLDYGLAATQKVCGDSGPTPSELTMRRDIVRSVNAYYAARHPSQPCTTPKADPVCIEVERRPMEVYGLLLDWLPALEAESRRQKQCRSPDPGECALALLNAARVTASALAADQLLAEWLPGGHAPQGTPCLASLAATIPGTGSSISSVHGPVSSLPDVISLWASPDQAVRRALEARLSEWRAMGRALAGKQSTIAHLPNACLRRVADEVVATMSGAAPTISFDAPRFDAAGHIVTTAFSNERGFHDFVSNGDGILAALRVRFPVLHRGDCPPEGSLGALSLIGRFRGSDGTWQSMEVASGVDEIHFTALCGGSLAFSSHLISPEQLRQALGKLMPPPLRLIDATAKLTFLPSPPGPGRLVLSVKAHIGIVGSDEAEEVKWDIGAGGTSLDAATLIDNVRPVLERRLAPVLGDAILKGGLYLAPPEGCGSGGDSSQMRGVRLYACLRLPSHMGLPKSLPAVLTTVDFDSHGRIQITPSRGGVAAVQDALTKVLADKVGEWSKKLGASRVALSRLHTEPTSDGLRLQLALSLEIGGTTVPWPLSLDVPYRGGEALKDQFLDQLPSAGDLGKLARDAADKAVLQALDDALARLKLPGIRIKERNVAERRLLLQLSLPIPGFENLEVHVDLHDPANVDHAIQEALRQAITKALTKMPEITLSGITMTKISLLEGRWALASTAVLYKDIAVGFTVPLDGRFIPVPDGSFSRASVTAALNGALGDSIKALTGAEIEPKFELIDGLPTLRISGTIDLTLLGPLSLAGKLKARISQRDGLTMERLRLECTGACWVPLGDFEVGDFSVAVDLPRPKNFAIGAKLALTPGAQTEKLLRLQAELTAGNPIRLDGSLQLLRSASLGTFTGVLDPGGERVRIQGAMQLPVLEIPLGSIEVELDGERCVLLGKGSQNFLGIGGVSIDTQLRFGRCRARGHSAVTMTLPTIGVCRDVEQSDVSVCVEGTGNVLKQTVSLSGAMSLLPLRAPLARASIDILGIDLNAEIRRNTVRLTGSLGGIAKINILLPALDTPIKREDVEHLLAQLLKPKLDWDAIRRRDITVSLIPSNSPQHDDDGSEASEHASSTADSSARQSIIASLRPGRPPDPSMPPNRTVLATTNPGGFLGPSLDCSGKAKRLYGGANAESRWWSISPEICDLKNPLLLDNEQLLRGETSLAIFCEQEASGCNPDTLKVTQTKEGEDASTTSIRQMTLPPGVRDALWKPWTNDGARSTVGLLIALASDPSLESTLQAGCFFRPSTGAGACFDVVAVIRQSAIRFAGGGKADVDQASLLWMALNLDPKGLRIPTNLADVVASTGHISLAGSAGGSVFFMPGKITGPPRNVLNLKRLSLDSHGALRIEETPINATFSGAPLPITATFGGWLNGRIASERKLVAHLGESVKQNATCSISLQGISYCRFATDAPGVAYAYVHDSARDTIFERSESCLYQDTVFWIDNHMLTRGDPSPTYWGRSSEFLSRIQMAADEWSAQTSVRTGKSFRSNPRLLVTNPQAPCEVKL